MLGRYLELRFVERAVIEDVSVDIAGEFGPVRRLMPLAACRMRYRITSH